MFEKHKEYDISQKKDLIKLASHFVSDLGSREVVLMEGPLGAGKTEWVRCCLKTLGYEKEISSPSFAIHHVYHIKDQVIDHIDLYRVQKESELESIDFFDLFLRDAGLIFIEWADRLSKEVLPKDWNYTYLKFRWENSKRILDIS
ncbi:MAG: tRNA (adenosine(37)-N6)-threonylcarbamoyltransferase complex ATPase subunit type 1 TsaE [Bdellovibrionales bacterium]|nr:tRNA (adenosine(37)-N6)-threonylcarbamoyltransferase complex ATPase subunit type 1 TsaE [Bdellovibrionales bacterium]